MPSPWAVGPTMGGHQEDEECWGARLPRVGGWLCPAGGLRGRGAGRRSGAGSESPPCELVTAVMGLGLQQDGVVEKKNPKYTDCYGYTYRKIHRLEVWQSWGV